MKNWAAHEEALKGRGDIIVASLTLREVFRLPLRQTEGFVASLIGLMGLPLGTPDHTTLSRRNRDVEIPHLARGPDCPLHLVIDSTGLRVFGSALLQPSISRLNFPGGHPNSPTTPEWPTASSVLMLDLTDPTRSARPDPQRQFEYAA